MKMHKEIVASMLFALSAAVQISAQETSLTTDSQLPNKRLIFLNDLVKRLNKRERGNFIHPLFRSIQRRTHEVNQGMTAQTLQELRITVAMAFEIIWYRQTSLTRYSRRPVPKRMLLDALLTLQESLSKIDIEKEYGSVLQRSLDAVCAMMAKIRCNCGCSACYKQVAVCREESKEVFEKLKQEIALFDTE